MKPSAPSLACHGVDLAGRHLDGDRESKIPAWSLIAEVQPGSGELKGAEDEEEALVVVSWFARM